MRSFIVSILLLLGYSQLFGQENRKEVCIGFRVGNSTLDVAYGDNAARLSEIISFLEHVRDDSTLELVEVSFCGSASPEGSGSINKRLATERCASIEHYVRKRILLPDSVISRCEGGIAWELLAQLVEQSDMPHKGEAIDVLRNVPEYTYNKSVLVDSRKKRLMELQYGRTWNYMLKNFFPQVRNASVILVTVRQKPKIEEKVEVVETPVVIPPTDTVVTAEEPADTVVSVPETKKPFRMAVKTNMLYDALAVPNIGIEFYLGKNWSVGANWMYGWWDKDSKHRFWRIYGGDLVIRKWFGKAAKEKPLTGHHLGLYGQLFTYDFEWGSTGYMGGKPGSSGWEKFNYAAGIEYGYSLPIAKRLNLDFTLGLGYWGGTYYKYIPLDGHYVWQETRNRHWFGPTKAEISLVWLLGRENSNSKKGGVK